MLSFLQGLTEEQFREVSTRVRAAVTDAECSIAVHGSRAAGTAKDHSDLDIAILVVPERFAQILAKCFGTPNPGTAKERTMQRARECGKIQAGEAGLRTLRRDLERILGIEVDFSIIMQGGAFDRGPYLPLPAAPKED
jgi:predicted nucleotidyltransferase